MNLSNLQSLTHLPFEGVILPTIEISAEQREKAGAKPNCSNVEFLTQLCREGYKQKIAPKIAGDKLKEYVERIRFELDTINSLGFTDYILMVWDICSFADQVGIPRGPGRGSVSSSLVCHLIGLTELDPIEHTLYFTRFLSKARAKYKEVNGIKYVDGGLVPDIDLDFGERRDEIFDYLSRKYSGQTCHTLTTGTLTSKALLLDVIKVFENGTNEEAHAASDLIERDAGTLEEIEDALSDDENKANARFKEWAKDHRETCEIAMKLSGINKSKGKHASAFLICAKPIDQIIPTQSAVDDKTKKREIVSAFDMYSAQEVVLKFDILGLKNLTLIKDVCDKIGIDPKSIDVHDPEIYRFLQDFKYRQGIFQLETFAQGLAATKVKPKNFDQLSATLAIARPGSIAGLDKYIKYVNEGVFDSIHPLIDDILRPTGMNCVFQEQYLAMLVKIGMDPERAENARKVLGKKMREKVPEVKAEIVDVCLKNGHPKEIVELLERIAEDSGSYQFAKAHSSAYSIITARTLYLKVHHPLEFYWALLRATKNIDELSAVEVEMRARGYKLLPPQFSTGLDFEIEGADSIRFALGRVRGLAEKGEDKLKMFIGSEAMLSCSSKFDVFMAMKSAGLSIGVVSSLIQAGCMEKYETYTDKSGKEYRSRSRLVLEACMFNSSSMLNDGEKTLCKEVGPRPEVNWDVIAAVKYLSTLTNEKGKPLIRESRLKTLRKRYQSYNEIYDMNRRNERLANYFYEKKVLGYSYSETLSGVFGEHIDGLVTIAAAKEMEVGSHCKIIGFVSEPEKRKTKAKNDEFKFILKDETGEVRVKAFNDRIKAIELHNGRLPEDSDITIVNCKKMEGDTFFVERGLDGVPVGISTAKIYMKLSDLKDAKAEKEERAGKESAKTAEIVEKTP